MSNCETCGHPYAEHGGMNSTCPPKQKRLSVRRRFRQIKDYTGTEFFGWYRGFQVEVKREPPDLGYYIMVSGSGGYLYDGWWTEGEYRPIDDAIYEALYGSQLLERPTLPASADAAKDKE